PETSFDVVFSVQRRINTGISDALLCQFQKLRCYFHVKTHFYPLLSVSPPRRFLLSHPSFTSCCPENRIPGTDTAVSAQNILLRFLLGAPKVLNHFASRRNVSCYEIIQLASGRYIINILTFFRQ